jgi:hypothetical protein
MPSWPQIWEFWIAYGVEMMPLYHGWSCHPIQTASCIHIRPIQSVWTHWYAVHRHMAAALDHYSGQYLTRIWAFWVTWQVQMMSLPHGRGSHPIQTAFHIHIRHIQIVWAIGMLSQGHIWLRFLKSGSLVELKWCHYLMVKAHILFILLPTSILDMYKLFELLVCCLKGTWVHPYTIPPAKWPQIWEF